MPQSFASLTYHVIFSTKDRRPLIESSYADDLYAYIGGIVRDVGGTLLTIGGMPDHVHLLMGLGRDGSMSAVMREVKAGSSRRLRMKDRSFGWQDGYAAFTVSYSNTATVQRYIERQAEHHRSRTFEEEFVEFLNAHRIQYDPRYLWK